MLVLRPFLWLTCVWRVHVTLQVLIASIIGKRKKREREPEGEGEEEGEREERDCF